MNVRDSILVTGGAGFIGSNFVLGWLENTSSAVLNLDLLTYAGNAANLASLDGNSRYAFQRGDICDAQMVARLLREQRPRAIVHFAAESHVDRSIVAPDAFVRTNVFGTFTLLEQARIYWNMLSGAERDGFRFLHVSTDEVYGTLGPEDPAFHENTPYAPNSPYAASKAGSDHLARAYFHTYGMPVLTTNCSNNYGPFQFPEKLIPLMILNALEGKPLPVYGDGKNVRDWLYVEDHNEAVWTIMQEGQSGRTYNIGGENEWENIRLLERLIEIVAEEAGLDAARLRGLITYVKDRPGHDRRYAIDCSKLKKELGWKQSVTFDEGLRQTVKWYLSNPTWVSRVRSGAYREWIEKNYTSR